MSKPKFEESLFPKKLLEFSNVDFGDVDGLYDDVRKFFVNFSLSDNVLDKNIFFVLGRKGTGKSALFNYLHSKQEDLHITIDNLSFNDLPIEAFTKCSDSNFSKPHEYTSIWNSIFLMQVAKQVATLEIESDHQSYKEIIKYVKSIFPESLTDLHKRLIEKASRIGGGLSIETPATAGIPLKLGLSAERSVSSSYSSFDISDLNRRLKEVLFEYFSSHSNHTTYIFQLDQLDDNYNLYVNKEDYLSIITSLMKTTYSLNKEFMQKKIRIKFLVYLRSDIYEKLHAIDAESAKWKDNIYFLKWEITTREDWRHSKLNKLLLKRVYTTFPDLRETSSTLNYFFPAIKFEQLSQGDNFFQYIVYRSFHRPRDVIRFCKEVQSSIKHYYENRMFPSYKNIIQRAEQSYSLWFISELKNEINPIVNDSDAFFGFLRDLGAGVKSHKEACALYDKYEAKIGIEVDNIFQILYKLGVIYNVGTQEEIFSSIRNEQSMFNESLKLRLSTVFERGLYFYTFTTKIQ